MGEIQKEFDVNLEDYTDETDDQISIELDDETNGNLSTFDPGSDVYLLIRRYPLYTYTVESGGGALQFVGAEIPIEMTEKLYFTKTDSADLDYVPEGEIVCTWQDPAPDVNITTDGKTVSLSAPAIGVLNCTYTTLVDRWRLHGVNVESEVIIVATMGEVSDNITVTFEIGSGTEATVAVYLKYCDSGEAAPNMAFYVNGEYQGVSDANGLVNIGSRTVGDSLSIRAIGSGIINSENDSIQNETLTI